MGIRARNEGGALERLRGREDQWAAEPRRAGPRQQQGFVSPVKKLGFQIVPGLKPRVFQTEPHRGAHIAQLVLREQQGQRIPGNTHCNHIENQRLHIITLST